MSADPHGPDPSAAEQLATEGELRAAADELFAGIWQDCRTCTDPDCVGYIWTVPSEQDRLLDGGLRLVELNGAGGPVFVDSYRRGPQGQVQVGDYRPRCPYLTRDGRCGMHATRPLSCHLYPLAPEWTTGGLRWVLHTDCNHVRRLSDTGGLPALLAACRATLARITPELRAEIVQTLTTVATVSTVRRAYDCFVVVADV